MDDRKPPPRPQSAAISKTKDDNELAKQKRRSASSIVESTPAKRGKKEQGKVEKDTKESDEKKKPSKGNKAVVDLSAEGNRQGMGEPEPSTKPAAIGNLDDAVLAKILHFSGPVDVLTSTSYVSKRFAQIAQSDQYWTNHPLLRSNETTAPLNKHQRQRICFLRGSRYYSTESLFVRYDEAVQMETAQQRLVCAASTTKHANCAANRLLSLPKDASEEERYVWRKRPWCSAMSSSQDSIDTLLFVTKCPLALMTGLDVEPYTFLTPPPNPKRLVVSAYRLPLDLLTNDVDVNVLAGFPCSFARAREPGFNQHLSDQETIDGLITGQTPVYVSSEEMDIDTNSNWPFSYAFPVGGVVANVVTLTLIGKNDEFRELEEYDVSLESVDCCGIPLYSSPSQATAVANRG